MKNLKNKWYIRLIVKFLYRKNVRKLTNKELNKSYTDLLLVKNGRCKSEFPKWQSDIALQCTYKELRKRKLI